MISPGKAGSVLRLATINCSLSWVGSAATALGSRNEHMLSSSNRTSAPVRPCGRGWRGPAPVQPGSKHLLHMYLASGKTISIARYRHKRDGNSGNSIIALDERTWIGDINSTFFPLEKFQNNASVTSKAAQQTLSPTVIPYATARLSRYEFTYVFRVTFGKKFIRLYFFPARYQAFEGSNALFSVKAGPYTLLREFNASVTADVDADESLPAEN
ncbi:Receptor-like protein kinase FERONIA [Morella rubra]|uniref:Receptor-like protein kinase FERONIA n=1 Tax=Morella rubra TaxID=262757 RepID=A0A6A1UR42_9ROSI|nr:Receptor-like protein kinase FERONIA [Morella rubra]